MIVGFVSDMVVELLDNMWKEHDDVFVTGDLFRNDGLYPVEKFAKDVRHTENLPELLHGLNGFFAIIVFENGLAHLCADHVRSIPLFYSTDEDLLIGDNFRRLKEQIGGSLDPDRIQTKEYLATGLVSGHETLYPGIKQVQAGELVTIDLDDGKVDNRTRYRRYRDEPSEIHSKSALFDQLEAALSNSFQRLIKFADGDPIIIPLSAGYDSRLIALMLKKLGYEEVYAFHSVHSETNRKITQSVADDLDIPLVLFQTDHNDLATVYSSSRWAEIEESVSGYGAIPPRPGNLSISKKLKESEKLPDHGVVTKGHHAATACLATSGILDCNSISTRNVVEQLWLDNFDMCQWSRRKYGDVFEEIVLDRTIGDDISSVSDAIRVRELWYWQERSPKRLIAHPKEYTCFGYRRWLPLWDREYMTVWNYVPDEYRVDKRLHKEYIQQLSIELCGRWVEPNKETGTSELVLSKLESAIRDTSVERLIRLSHRRIQSLKRSLDPESVYRNTPQLAFVPEDVFCQTYRGHERYHYYMALNRMDQLPESGSELDTDGVLRRSLTDPLSISESVGSDEPY